MSKTTKVPDMVEAAHAYHRVPVLEARIKVLEEALKGMEKAADEIAAEFIRKKRATDWAVVNDAYCATRAALNEGK